MCPWIRPKTLKVQAIITFSLSGNNRNDFTLNYAICGQWPITGPKPICIYIVIFLYTSTQYAWVYEASKVKWFAQVCNTWIVAELELTTFHIWVLCRPHMPIVNKWRNHLPEDPRAFLADSWVNCDLLRRHLSHSPLAVAIHPLSLSGLSCYWWCVCGIGLVPCPYGKNVQNGSLILATLEWGIELGRAKGALALCTTLRGHKGRV